LAEVPVEDGKTVAVNEYFAAHPEMVLGNHSQKGTMYAKGTYTVLPQAGDIEEQFAQAVAQLPKNIYSVVKRPAAEQKQIVGKRTSTPKQKECGSTLPTGANCWGKKAWAYIVRPG
jgi:N12 class adenine-specific DNA methylase